MLTIGIAVAVVAFVIVDIIAVQGLDLTAFNTTYASLLYSTVTDEPGNAGICVQTEGREIKQVSDMPSIFIAERMRFSIHFQGRFLPA